MRKVFLSALVLVVMVVPVVATDATIVGDYVESRTADVYAGPCHSNSEVNLTGQEAIMAWRVREGSWEGVSLKGLTVMAVIKARATLGDPFANPLPARSLLVVDSRANKSQQQALAQLARSMGGDLLDNVVAVESAEVKLEMDRASQAVSLQAGDFANLNTRALVKKDLMCGGTEEVALLPLASIADAAPAFTIRHEFRGKGLDSTWSSPRRRSAFIGTFAQ